MNARKFDVFRLTMQDISMLRAYRREGKSGAQRVVFSFEDSLKFRTVRKRNTQLHDALYRLFGEHLAYTADERVITDFLYDMVVVEMRAHQQTPHAVCLTQEDGVVARKNAKELPALLYHHGFDIENVPARHHAHGDAAVTQAKTLHYVPFVASASMARVSEYLFVREDLADALMRSLSLDMLGMKGDLPYALPALKADKKGYLSPAKISAYLGLMLSDGQSVREMQRVWADRYGADSPAPEVDFDEKSVVCVDDWEDFPMELEDVASHVLKMHEFSLPRPQLRAYYGAPLPEPDEEEISLKMFFWRTTQSSTASAKTKKQMSDAVREEWKALLGAITLSDIRPWSGGGRKPLYLTADYAQIETNLLRTAFLSAARMMGGSLSLSLEEDNLPCIKEKLMAAVDAFFADRTDFAPLKALLSFIRPPKKASDMVTCWEIAQQNGALTLRLSQAGSASIPKEEEKAKEEYAALSRLFALLADGRQEDFLSEMKNSQKTLLVQWKKALGEVHALPDHLHSSMLPACGQESLVRRSVHGYAFVYAAAVYLKQAGIAECRFAMEDADEGGEEAQEATLSSLIERLCGAVDQLFDFKKMDNQAAGLYRSVRAGESGGDAEFFTCESCEEERDGAAPVKMARICLQVNAAKPYMAQLTRCLPAALCQLFERLWLLGKQEQQQRRKETQEGKNAAPFCVPQAFARWVEENRNAVAVRCAQWAKEENHPEGSLFALLHKGSEKLNQIGFDRLDAQALYEKMRGESALLEAIRGAYRKEKDRYFENTVNLYDGCGFADDVVCDALERLITGEKEISRRFTAFIVRWPWMKGLLIRLNWQKILLENRDETSGDGLFVQDAFGVKRSLAGAHVLVGKSMFKGFKQVKNVDPDYAGGEIKADQAAFDPWKYYWDKIHQHGFSLLITGRDSAPSKTTRLNYQFLSTLCPDAKTLGKMAQATLERVADAYNKPEEFLSRYMAAKKTQEERETDGAFSGERIEETQTAAQDRESGAPGFEDVSGLTDEDLDAILEAMEGDPFEGLAPAEELGALFERHEAAAPASDNESAESMESGLNAAASEESVPPVNEVLAQMRLLEKNGDFAATPYMRGVINARLRSLVLEMMRGQLPDVEGDVRFIVPDLDAMLRRVGSLLVREGEEAIPLSRTYSAINEYDACGMGRYFAPAPKEHASVWFDADGNGREAVALRNPHLSGGEAALLTPLSGETLERYQRLYGHLHGVAMISGPAFYVMGGGDCDGDRASLVTMPEIVSAGRQSAARINAAIAAAIEKKPDLLERIEEKQKELDKKAGQENRISYLQGLRMLLDALPEHAPRMNDGVCPPPIFAGSGASGSLVDPGAVREGSRGLKEAFYRTFRLTTEQTIGIMSLDALDHVCAAYRVPIGEETMEKLSMKKGERKVPAHSKELLEWLLCWRATNAALQTALEIDMAKTSLRPLAHMLQHNAGMDEWYFGCESAPRHSRFRLYRDEFVQKRSEITRITQLDRFAREARRMIGETAPRELCSEGHPLDVLPSIVFEAFMQVKDRLCAGEAQSFRALFGFEKSADSREALFEDLSRLREEEAAGREISPLDPLRARAAKAMMLDALAAYARNVSARKEEEKRRALLGSSCRACLRYLLTRYPLGQGLMIMQSMLPPGGSGETSALRRRLSSGELEALDMQLRRDDVLAQFVWEKDEERRKQAYRERLGVDLTPLDEKERALCGALSASADGVYLLKQYVKYLVQEDKMNAGAEMSLDGVHTPAALRAKLLGGEIRAAAGDYDVKALLYELCAWLLGSCGGMMQEKEGKKLRIMSEFLMIHLLGDMLDGRLMTQEEAKAWSCAGREVKKP